MPNETQSEIASQEPDQSAGASRLGDSRPRPANASRETAICPNCGKTYRPGVLVCPQCGIVLSNRLKTKFREEPVTMSPTCPNCGQVHRRGDPVCRVCGATLNTFKAPLRDDTTDFTAELPDLSGNSEVCAKLSNIQVMQTPIFAEVDGLELMLPFTESVIIGRRSGRSGEGQPDIDLTPFGALEKGVSRRHIEIKRKGTLVLVTDIGSANGTWLNGQRLIANGERLLHHGDELQLSHLKLRVSFSQLNA